MKRILLIIILSLIVHLGFAQLKYSVMVGCNWPNAQIPDYYNYYEKSKKPSFTFSINVDYIINSHIGIQTGVKYLTLKGKEIDYDVTPLRSERNSRNIKQGENKIVYESNGTYLQLPLVLKVSPKSNPQHYRFLWGVGPFASFCIDKDNGECKYIDEDYKSYWGIMAMGELEIRKHYILCAEYQWGVSTMQQEKTRARGFSIMVGYRF